MEALMIIAGLIFRLACVVLLFQILLIELPMYVVGYSLIGSAFIWAILFILKNLQDERRRRYL